MKRELIMALLGATFLAPLEADAQRARNRDQARDRTERVDQPAPVHATGRVATPFGRRDGFERFGRSRVVYSSRAPYRASGRQAWVRADWRGVRFGAVRQIGRDRVLSQGQLRRVIGKRAVDRVREVGRRSGLRGSLRGHWVRGGQGRVLVVTMDRVEIAEFIDFDRDGFVDEVFYSGDAPGRRVDRRW